MTDQTGRRGYLRLVLEDHTRTVLAGHSVRAPFHVQRVMHCDESLPNMAYLYMMSTSGGTLGGDSHRIDITLGENATAHVTTQGATRIYGTRSEAATQATEITLHDGSYLEFMPDQTIPYGNSNYSQTTRITASRTAALVYTDVVASGRRAMGESFQFDSFRTETVARDDTGDVIFCDAAVLEPKRRGVTGYGVMGGHTVAGTVYILAPKSRTARLYGMVNTLVSNHSTVPGGASTMRGDAGVLVRLLGGDARSVMSLARGVASIVREELLGVALPDDRKS